MVEEVVIGVAVFVIAAILAWVGGLFQAPRRVRGWRVEIRRAGKDYSVWRDRADREFGPEAAHELIAPRRWHWPED